MSKNIVSSTTNAILELFNAFSWYAFAERFAATAGAAGDKRGEVEEKVLAGLEKKFKDPATLKARVSETKVLFAALPNITTVVTLVQEPAVSKAITAGGRRGQTVALTVMRKLHRKPELPKSEVKALVLEIANKPKAASAKSKPAEEVTTKDQLLAALVAYANDETNKPTKKVRDAISQLSEMITNA